MEKSVGCINIVFIGTIVFPPWNLQVLTEPCTMSAYNVGALCDLTYGNLHTWARTLYIVLSQSRHRRHDATCGITE